MSNRRSTLPAESGGHRVLLDATSIPEARGGVARFIGGLTTGLGELGRAIDIVVKEQDLDFLQNAAPLHRYHVAPARVGNRILRFAWEQLGLPRLASRLGCDAIHSPHYTFPLFTSARRIVTVHDATFFTMPAAHSRVKGIFFRTWTKWACRRASTVVTVSEATRSELMANVRVRVPVEVAYLGVDPQVFRVPDATEIATVRAKLHLDEEWIAFLGTIEPRKNVPALITAVQRLRRRRPGTPRLVVSGARGWDNDAARLLDDPETAVDVTEAGYLPLDSLRAFLGGAVAVAYPSSAEGFGLPVLEAMASGATVLTTRRLALPEVGGDAVAYTEPDSSAIEEALEGLLDDSDERRRLRDAAIVRSRLFTWRACAEVYSGAYREGVV